MLVYRPELQYRIIFIGSIYKLNICNGRNTIVVNTSAAILKKLYYIGVCLYICTGVVFITSPLIVYVLTGTIELIVNIQVPGLNQFTTYGYIMLTIYHSLCAYAATVGAFATDLFFVSMVYHTRTMAELFKNALEDFNTSMAMPAIKPLQRKAALRNILQMHKELYL